MGIKTEPDSTDNIMTTTDNPARIAGRPASEPFMALPVDRGVEINGLVYGKDNKIADCGWVAEGAQINDWETGDSSWDIDNSPAYGPDGDDLVTLEEYRGFKVAMEEHMRTNPFHKDVFIASSLEVEGIHFAYPALPTSTHRVDFTDYQPNTNMINWQAAGIDGHRPQCAIPILSSAITMSPEWQWGFTNPKLGKSIPGPPCNVQVIDIYRLRIHLDNQGHGADESVLARYTVGHEAGHGVSIGCRPCNCVNPANNALMCQADSIGIPGCLFTDTPHAYDASVDLPQLDLINP